jgi:hypothetical protein
LIASSAKATQRRFPHRNKGKVTTVNRYGRLQAATRWVLLGTISLGAFGLVGCGGTLYAIQAVAASSKFEEAKAVGAEKLAPYEYYLADEQLKKASEEASQANYGDAVDLADEAEKNADKAVKLARDAHKGAGR